MEWYALQHGWQGLLGLLLLVLVPMWIGMMRGEVHLQDWWLSPVYAAALAFAIVGITSLLFPLARIAVGMDESGLIAGAIGTGMCVISGYITGRRHSLRAAAPKYLEGTKVVDAREARPPRD